MLESADLPISHRWASKAPALQKITNQIEPNFRPAGAATS
jgi:hypothetical protein